MILKIADWQFRVDKEATWEKTNQYSRDHCTCGYCKNYYDTVENTHPRLKSFLGEFGVFIHGPVEVMPFEPTLLLACYRIQGQILQWGKTALMVDGIPVTPEAGDESTFLLWIGELEVPWIQEEDMNEVVSPANLPEFLERMHNVWQLRHGSDLIYS